jgi:hypothetical protein
LRGTARPTASSGDGCEAEPGDGGTGTSREAGWSMAGDAAPDGASTHPSAPPPERATPRPARWRRIMRRPGDSPFRIGRPCFAGERTHCDRRAAPHADHPRRCRVMRGGRIVRHRAYDLILLCSERSAATALRSASLAGRGTAVRRQKHGKPRNALAAGEEAEGVARRSGPRGAAGKVAKGGVPRGTCGTCRSGAF